MFLDILWKLLLLFFLYFNFFLETYWCNTNKDYENTYGLSSQKPFPLISVLLFDILKRQYNVFSVFVRRRSMILYLTIVFS